MVSVRDNSLDVIRGLAILFMIPANYAPFLLDETPPFWFRVVESLAAPLFVSVSGYVSSVYFTGTLSKNLKRSAFILIVAALVDLLIWRTIPFITYDVLYLIGLCIMLHFVVKKLKAGVTIMVGTILMLSAPFIQWYFGYSHHINYYHHETGEMSWGRIFGNLMIDGWFPILPWAGISILGRFFYLQRVHFPFVVSAVLIGCGLLYQFFFPSPIYVREGCSELFYPPGAAFIFIITGILVLVFHYRQLFSTVPGFIGTLGRRSLAVYCIHLAIAEYVLHDIPLKGFNILLLASISSIIFIIAGIKLFEFLRKRNQIEG